MTYLLRVAGFTVWFTLNISFILFAMACSMLSAIADRGVDLAIIVLDFLAKRFPVWSEPSRLRPAKEGGDETQAVP